MASTSPTFSTSPPLSPSPPSLPPISSSDDYESLADSLTIPLSSMDSSTHSPPLPLPLPPAYTTDTQETFDKDDVELDLDPGLPALPPGLGGFGTSAGATEQLPEQSGTPLRILVPIPTVSSAADSISFAFPDPTATMDGELSILSKPLPQESEADVVIAPDSTYVETSSAPWAMELKRRYDTLYGVNVIVRSPYAITAFVGQHGQKRYRIGPPPRASLFSSHRELSAPGATAAAAEDILVLSNLSKQSKSPPPQTSPQSSKVGIGVGGGRSKSNSIRSPSGSITKPASKASLNSLEISSSRPSHKSQSFSRASKSGKRHSRGRISINALLGSGSASSPSTSAVGSTPRKLKKPRSNPDLSLSSPSGDPGYGYSGYGYTYGYGQHPPSAYNSTGTTVFGGRMHSLSVTATDMPHVVGIDPANPPLIPSSSLFPNPTHITTPPTKLPERKGDSFGEIMGWRNHLIPSHMSGTLSGFSTSAPSTGYVAHSTHNLFFEPRVGNMHAIDPAHAKSVSTTAINDSGLPLSSATGSGFVPRPFGPGVHFETPAILRSNHSHRSTHHEGKPMNESFRASTRSRSGSGSESGSGYESGSTSERDLESDPEDPESETESDYGRFLKVQNSPWAHRRLKEMQSFESGLTATPLPPVTPTLAGTSVASASNTPRTNSSTTTRLEVDLGDDINLNLGEIVNIVDMALSENTGQKVIGRQRSAIKLVDRDREREKMVKARILETIEAEAADTPNLTSASASVSGSQSDAASYPLSEDGFSQETVSPSSPLHDQYPNSSPQTHSSNLEPSDDTTHSLINDIHKVPDSGVNDIESRSQPDFSTPQTPQTPRVQMYSPSGLPPRLAKFATYSTEIFDVLQTSRGLPRLDLLDLRVSDQEDDVDITISNDSTDDDSNRRSSSRSSSRRTPLPETVPVKLSLSQDGSAAPKDDPRFVIWGEVTPSETSGLTGCDASSVSHESSTSTNSSMSISLGVKGKGRASDFQFTVGHGVNGSASATLSEDGSGKTRVLLAATIERWLAQLTSDLDYDELLNFFLTYRTYISALDLARLLMTRFCWALGRSIAVSSLSNTGTSSHSFSPFSPPTTASTSSTATVKPEGSSFTTATIASTAINTSIDDDVVRRIVRVRTFVAFKYWLITFFTVDFVPNRELRLYVANHLNDLAKELGDLGREAELAGTEMGKEGREMKEMEMGMSRGAIVDGVSIVKKLKNVAKDCKKLYTRNNTVASSSRTQNSNKNSQPPSDSRKDVRSEESNRTGKENLFGENFAEATRKLSAASALTILDTDDSDVDLDFIDEPSSTSSPYSGVYGKTPVNNVHLGGASTLNLSTAISPPGPGSIPLSSFSILQRTDHAPGPEFSSGPMYSSSMNANATTIPHNALSRVLVKTLGRLGRWKRVLNSGGVAHGVSMHRSMTTGGLGKPHIGGGFSRMATACADVSAFDVELTVDSSDLLSSSGGVESYLRLVEGQSSQVPRNYLHTPSAALKLAKASSESPIATPSATSATTPSPVTPTLLNSGSKTPNRHSFTDSLNEAHLPSSALPRSAPDDHIMSLPASDQSSEPPEASQNRDSIAETESDYGAVTNVHELRDSLIPSPRANEESFNDVSQGRESRATRRSSRTSSTGSFGEPLSASRASARFPAFTSPWQFDVVSLDDLSDNSSDEHDNANRSRDAPGDLPGLRRPPRRLPLRREFEFLERPETVSSMGIISRSSIVSASSASGQSTASHTSSSSAAGGLGAGIQQWQMNALKDSLMDDEEPGDVDEALKRLEGQINPQKRLEKASKVNGWVKTIRERLAAGDYSDEEPMYSDDDDDDAEVEPHEGSEDSFSRSAQGTESTSATMLASTDIPPPDADSVTATTPVVEQIDQVASPARSTDSKPAVEDAVPLEIRQSRLSSELPSVTPERISKFVDPSIGPKVAHRSFVLLFKAEDLAQHFAMIDRELFMTIKFEELLLEDWMYCEEVDTLDWAQFLKDRARWKAEARLPEKTSALGAVRARFNLMVNFTVSEIVLTNQAERLYVFSKFLRIAWKSYQRNSFNTLVAIMTGLQSSWVTRAMRRSMNKLSIWDKRMLADLKLFTSREDNFRHIRCAVDAINDAKPFEATSLASSVVSAVADSVNDQPTPSACIPFVGTYLSQLYQHNQLPVLVDPTAPNEVVMVDPVSPNFSSPAHPEVFSTLAPLPSSMHLEPLINVHRQRLIAAVIKSLVAGQHLASRAQFPIDKKLFHKCLRIRGLDSNTLHRALALKSP
ncbi:uncharacterized protein C8R40DRAFT_1266840 [Lentinula edodes]|uniref:uncharacterized protein n=1 Tax=Lentinula edodes TaxID=5353 RepID=UPI001E8D4647|nr:uncharacterized protein C8R40DRAFT_1266840 [Lentinula edodes]KAH7872412.1 hypothetical protein C8R40DRAFT_1266840 [Lentinula edodes]